MKKVGDVIKDSGTDLVELNKTIIEIANCYNSKIDKMKLKKITRLALDLELASKALMKEALKICGHRTRRGDLTFQKCLICGASRRWLDDITIGKKFTPGKWSRWKFAGH